MPHWRYSPASFFSGPVPMHSCQRYELEVRKSRGGTHPQPSQSHSTYKESASPHPHASLTLFAMASGRRVRFSKDPPYLSVRLLERGDLNSWIR